MSKKKDPEQHGLTVKQKKFVDLYIKYGNKTKAAKEAGYSPKYADRQANQTLQLDYVQSYLHEQLDKLHAKNIASAEEVLIFLTRLMNGKISEQVVAPNSSIVELRANNSERLNAAKELLKRYPTSMVKAQMKKLEAETKLTNAKTKMLTDGDDNTENSLSDILDKIEDKELGKKDDDK